MHCNTCLHFGRSSEFSEFFLTPSGYYTTRKISAHIKYVLTKPSNNTYYIILYTCTHIYIFKHVCAIIV